MAIEGKVRTLYTDKTQQEAIFPTTKVSAVTDDEGNGLNTLLEHIAYVDPMDMESAAVLANADTLGGYPASDYATRSFVSNAIKAIDYPVDSVNGKTGDVTLSASDVGAMPVIEYGTTGCYYHMTDIGTEWFNPPLDLGVEYLTTERYKGLPVYIKACELDLSTTGHKYVGIYYPIAHVVSINGSVYNRSDGLTYPIARYAENMFINVSGNFFSNFTDNSIAYPIVKYTKSKEAAL